MEKGYAFVMKEKLRSKRLKIAAIVAPLAILAGIAVSIGLLHAAESTTEYPVGSYAEIMDTLNNKSKTATMYLTNDLDMSEYPNGFTEPFLGTLDGDGWSVKNLKGPLFKTVNGGTVKNIAIETSTIPGSVFETVQNGGLISNIRLLTYSQVRYEAGSRGPNTPAETVPITGGTTIGSLVGSLNNSSVYAVYNFGSHVTGSLIGKMSGSTVANVVTRRANKQYSAIGDNYIYYDCPEPSMDAPVVGGVAGTNTIKNVWLEFVNGFTGTGDTAAVLGGDTGGNTSLNMTDITVKGTPVTSTGGKAGGIAVNLLGGNATLNRVEVVGSTITGQAGSSGWFANAPATAVTVTSSRVAGSTVTAGSGTSNGFAPGGVNSQYCYIAGTTVSGGTAYMAGQNLSSFTGCVYEPKGTANITSGGAKAGLTQKANADFLTGDTLTELGHGGTAGKGSWVYLKNEYPRPAVPLSGYADWDSHLLMESNVTRRAEAAKANYKWELRRQMFGPDFSMDRSYIFVTDAETIDFSGMRGAVQYNYNECEVGGGTAAYNANIPRENFLQGFQAYTGILDGNGKVLSKLNRVLICRIDGGGIRDLGIVNTTSRDGNYFNGVLTRFALNGRIENVFVQSTIGGRWANGGLTCIPTNMVISNCFVSGEQSTTGGYPGMLFGERGSSSAQTDNCYTTGRLINTDKGYRLLAASGPATNSYSSETVGTNVPVNNGLSVPYDKQAASIASLANAQTTADLTDPATAKTLLTGDNWTFVDGLYPQLKVFAESDSNTVRANSIASAIPLPLAGAVQSDGSPVTALTLGTDLELMTRLPGQSVASIVWSADRTGLVTSGGSTGQYLKASTAATGQYVLTAIYTDPATKASAYKRFSVKVNKVEPLVGSIRFTEQVTQTKFPCIEYIGGNSDGKGTLRVYMASQCTQAADGSWTPNSGAAQLYARNEMRINGPNSSGSWDSHWAVPTSVPVGEKLVAIYSPSPDDVKTGTISGVSNAVQAVQDINTGGYTISAYDAVTNKTVAQAAAGKQYYADFVGTTPPMQKRIDYYTNLYVVEKNSQGQDVGTPVKLPYSAATGRWDAIPYEAAGKYLRMTVNCTNAQFFAHRGTLTLDIPIVDANTVTGQVTVKALQYADGNPRTGKKLTANYVKNGSNPDNGANGTWIWEVQAKGSSAWTAVSADLIFPLGAAGYDGSYIYVPESSLGGKYRVSYKASSISGLTGSVGPTVSGTVEEPPILKGDMTITFSGDTPPMVDNATFTAKFTPDSTQSDEDTSKGAYQWGYLKEGVFTPFPSGATGTIYVLKGDDFGVLKSSGSPVTCAYKADADGKYTGNIISSYHDFSADDFVPASQPKPGGAVTVSNITDGAFTVGLEANMSYAIVTPDIPAITDPGDSRLKWCSASTTGSAAFEVSADKKTGTFKGLKRNTAYTLYQWYPARTGYTASVISDPIKGKTTTLKTVLPDTLTMYGAPNKDGTLTVTVPNALQGSYTLDWQYKRGGAYTGIGGKTGLAQTTNDTYTLKLDYSLGLQDGDSVRVQINPTADFQTARTSPEVGPLVSYISMGSEADLRHFGNTCVSTCPDGCKFAGLTAEEQKEHAYKQTADVACTAAYSPLTLKNGGSYDGQGHTVTGLKNSLFASVGGTVKNLTLLRPVAGNGGTLAESVSSNAVISGILVIDPTVTSSADAGGLFGRALTSRIADCAVIGGSISAPSGAAGGLLGTATTSLQVTGSYTAQTTVSGVSAGAFVGQTADSTFTSCYYDKQTSSTADTAAAGVLTTDLTKAGGPSGFAAANWSIKEGYYPLPAAAANVALARLYATPVFLQNGETLAKAFSTIPLTKTDTGGGAVSYAISGSAQFVENGDSLWFNKAGKVTLTVTAGGLSRTVDIQVPSGQANVQALTATAGEKGQQTLTLTTPLYTAVTDEADFYGQKASGSFDTAGTGLSRNAAVKNNVHAYGSNNANANIYMEMSGTAGQKYALSFVNAAAYTVEDNRYFQLKVYRGADKSLYDLINVTLKPMTVRTLDITVPVASATIQPDSAENYTVSYSSTLTVTSKAQAPITLTLSGVSSASVNTLPIRSKGWTDWAATKKSLKEAGVALDLINTGGTLLTAYDPADASPESFASIGYGQNTAYRIKLYHPKLVSTKETFQLTMTYSVGVSPTDIS